MEHISPVTIISEDHVRKHLTMPVCIDLMQDLFGLVSSGKTNQPLRTFVSLPEGSTFANMPCAITTPSNQTFCGTKMLTICPKNVQPVPSIQGVIMLFGQAQNGQPLALIEASSITAIRTAAASGLATRILAREDSKTCAIIGSGVQAESHVEAMLCARPSIERIFIANRTTARVGPLVKKLSQRYANSYPNLKFIASESIEEAVKEADIVCTVTGSAEPIVLDSMITKPGVHINAVGAHGQAKREIDGPLVKRASVWADFRASTMAEGGDFLIPMRQGLFQESHLQGDLADLVSKTKEGRKSPSEVTMFNSLGLAIEDLQCAIYLYKTISEEASSSSSSPQSASTVRLMSRL